MSVMMDERRRSRSRAPDVSKTRAWSFLVAVAMGITWACSGGSGGGGVGLGPTGPGADPAPDPPPEAPEDPAPAPPAPPPPPMPGDIVVTVRTIGEQLDPDGYRLTLDGADTGGFDLVDERTFEDLMEGAHEVGLEDVSDRCRVTLDRLDTPFDDGGTPTDVEVVGGETATVDFVVFCLPEGMGTILWLTGQGGGARLHGMDPNGLNQRMVFAKAVLGFDPNADGTLIVWDRDADLFTSVLDGSMPNVRQNEIQVTNTSQFFEGLPSLSEDGTRIAFQRRPAGAPNDSSVFVMDFDGSNVVELVNVAEFDGDPAWSPDGTRIAFRRDDPEQGVSGLYVVDADGTGERQLTSGAIHGDAAWSPDGTRIAFTKNGCAGGIWVVNADGTGERMLTVSRCDAAPTWSPDGQWIAFSSNRANPGSPNLGVIHVMRADGTDVVRITQGSTPHWIP